MGSKTCGMCLQVTGSGVGSGATPITGTFKVFVNNECPSCAASGLDFGESGDGVWGIVWQAVPCPVTSNILYTFKSGSSASWMGLQASNTRYPVYTFEIQTGGAWLSLPRQSYNYFVESVPNVVAPFQIRLTAITGEQLIDTIPSITNGVTFTGSIQFTQVTTV